MNVRTLAVATSAVAVAALLLPAVQTGASAEPPPHSRRPAAPACAVTVDPGESKAFAGGPVLRDATHEYDPVNYPETLGYYVKREEYPGSSTFLAKVRYATPSTGGCGTISVLTFPYVVVDGTNVMLPDAVQATTAVLTGSATKVDIDSLIVGLPPNSKRNDIGLCVGSQLEVRDAAGAVVQRVPETGPMDVCPVGPGKTYAG